MRLEPISARRSFPVRWRRHHLDGGALLLRETDRRLNLLARLTSCFDGQHQPWLVSHTVQEMVAQRVHTLALGYEDLTDHDQLRENPLLGVFGGKRRVSEEPLAGRL